MMARPYCVVVALLLLAMVSGFGEGASNPGFVARITRKGLEYGRRFGVAILKKELSTIKLPDFSGSFKVGWIKSVSYDFYRLKIHRFELRNSDLRLRPRQGVTASLSNNYVFVSGNWKVKKAFVTLDGTFDVSVDGISISVSLNLGKDHSGRPTASVAHCRSSIGHISADISGRLSWILNLFHERIENNFKNILEQKVDKRMSSFVICEMVRKSTTSHLEPYLRTLPVILMIDQVAGIDYSLVGAPQVTSQVLDTPFKGEFFGRNWHSPAPFDAPTIRLTEKHDHMVYFAVSEYVFNTASRVYHQAGRMNFTIQNKHIPMDSPIRLHTSSFRTIIPRLARLYPNTELELEMSPESAPFLRFTPGNVTLMPVLDIQAFALLPTSSDRKPLFQLRVTTNISATISVSSDRIVGSVTTGSKLKLELKHSNVRFINVELMEAILNYYALHTIYPSLNAKLEEGFPLPLPRDTHLNSLELQVHENFLLLGANLD
ncbi:lipopolysaccharide-binding protein-like isoform X1 [Ursus maritimus]|uniref:Bactericidal permeability-increasing protein n=1 Tax=Ursus maritimus TaxID=29073 RepID=A0A384CNC4_URSMA|nr:lipopolysaccharide-binding protein-like isoform X1 [Ursus maritimus]